MAAWWHRGSQMPTVEERLAYLEGRGEDVRDDIREVRGDIRDLRSEMRDLRGEMNQLRGEMNHLRGEMSDMRAETNRRFDAVDTKFTWLIGIQVTMLLMMAGVLFGAYLH